MQQAFQIATENRCCLCCADADFAERLHLSIEHLRNPAAWEERRVRAKQQSFGADDAQRLLEDRWQIRGRGFVVHPFVAAPTY